MSNTKKVVNVTIIETKQTSVKWYWWIFWLVFFWPMLFVLYLYQTFSSDKVYQVGITYSDNSKEILQGITEEQLNAFKIEAFENQ